MNKFWILYGLVFVFALSSVMGANCLGTMADAGGCTISGTITQSEDITFNGSGYITANGGIWDCDGYQLIGLGKGTGTLFTTNLQNVQGVRVRNCRISNFDRVWFLQSPNGFSGQMSNNFLEYSSVDSVTTVMEENGLNNALTSFVTTGNGIDNTNITNSDYGLISTGAYNQDGVGSGIFTNNIMSGGLIGVRIGTTSHETYSLNQVTLTGWVIRGNQFTGMTDAGVWVRQGSSTTLANITNNVFDGSSSGIITERSAVVISGNTFSNGAKGQNGCVEPPYQGVPLIMTSSTVPLCSGTYNQTDTIYVNAGTKVYPSGGVGTLTLFDKGATNSISTPSNMQGISKDNVEIYGINFQNFTIGIYSLVDCHNDALYPVTDNIDDWNMHDNVFTDVSQSAGTTTYGIYLAQSDNRYCQANNMVMRDNTYNQLDVGIYIHPASSNGLWSSDAFGGSNEISFSTFNNVGKGIKENGYAYWADYIVVFNVFNQTTNEVFHTSFDWFGNVGYGGVYIQDQNNCQKPDLIYYPDADVTFCSGTYNMTTNLIPSGHTNIYCDGTILRDSSYHSKDAFILQPYYIQGSYRKPLNADHITIENCRMEDYYSGVLFTGFSNLATYDTSYNVFKDNEFLNTVYGIRVANSPQQQDQAVYEVITGNQFINQTEAGVYLECSVTNPYMGTVLNYWNITSNIFQNDQYGIKYQGCNSGSFCGNGRLRYHNILNNVFTGNDNHVQMIHSSVALCPLADPQNITAHGNTFTRDYTAYAVANLNGAGQDFTLNNWGTGYTDVIDTSIYDNKDASALGIINYIPITGYTLVVGTPYAVQENWEDAVSTATQSVETMPITSQVGGYDQSIQVTGKNKWLLARSNVNARGSVYLSNDATCQNTYCYKSVVDSNDVNPHYARVTRFFAQTINMTTDTRIRFKVLYESSYWDSGGALIFRKEDNSITFKIDLGITNETNYIATTNSAVCRIKDITGLPTQVGTAGNDVWYSFDISLNDIRNACPVYASIFSNSQMIDRMEFVFGGKRNGVVGDVIWYLDDIDIQNVDFNTPPSNTPPIGAVIKWQETFGTVPQPYAWNHTATNCIVQADGYGVTDFYTGSWQSSGGLTGQDHDWKCWLNSSTGSPSLVYQSSRDTLHISSDTGLKYQSSGSVNPIISSWSTAGSYDVDMAGGSADHFLFTCDMSNQTHGYSYLLLAKNDGWGIDPTYSGYISLTNGGCAYNSTLPYQTDAMNQVPCCELITIAGQDCSAGKTKIEFDEQAIDDNCYAQNLGDASVSHIDRVELVNLKRTTGTDNIFFDDIYFYNTGFIGNNSLPNILTMDGHPDPANVSQVVSTTVGISDLDSNASQIYSAFDCEDDGVLEFGWSLRGISPTFTCSYNAEATYTARAWVSDTQHYPNYNTSMTNSQTVLIPVVIPSPIEGGSCTGYSAQSCTGNCYFTDNFNYNFMISCAGWSGSVSVYRPTDNVFGVFGLDIYHDAYELDKGTTNSIKATQTASFETSFDLRMKSNDAVNFQIYNDELNKNVMVLLANNYNLIAYKDTGSLNLGSLTPNTWYNIKAIVNYPENKIYYYINNNLTGTINIYEAGAVTSRKWIIGWSQDSTTFDMDNFRINTLQASENATNTSTTTEVNYVYDGNMFCAINWTASEGSTDRFSEANCEARGFPTTYPLMSLCIPRACLQDIGLSTMNWATSNIFRTIIIVSAFILIAPLLVALLRKR